MNAPRTRNVLLALVAVLLLSNMWLLLGAPAHAAGTVVYKAVRVPEYETKSDADLAIQAVLDGYSAKGWQYVGWAGSHLIFKK